MSYARSLTIHTQAGTLDEVVTVEHESMLPAATQQQGVLDARRFSDRATGNTISVVRRQAEDGRSRCHPGSKVRKQGNKRNNRACKVYRRDNNSSWGFTIRAHRDSDPPPLDVQEPWSVLSLL
jgi:hypothetical protein